MIMVRVRVRLMVIDLRRLVESKEPRLTCSLRSQKALTGARRWQEYERSRALLQALSNRQHTRRMTAPPQSLRPRRFALRPPRSCATMGERRRKAVGNLCSILQPCYVASSRRIVHRYRPASRHCSHQCRQYALSKPVFAASSRL